MRISCLVLLMFLTCSIAPPLAAEAATLTGTVVDSDGAGQAELHIILRSARTGHVHEAISDGDGMFRLHHLAPGVYEVLVHRDGQDDRAGELEVEAGRLQRIVITTSETGGSELRAADLLPLGAGGVSNLQVPGALADLPLQREMMALAQLAPGTFPGDSAFNQRTPGQDLISMGGASVAESSYQLNGFDITDVRNGLGFTMVPPVFVEALQVSIGGAEAEYGRSTGGLVNMISTSGTNTFHGGVDIYFEPESLHEQEPDVYFADNQSEQAENLEANAILSGPIWQDRMFFVGFVQYIDGFRTAISAPEQGSPGSGQVQESSVTEPYYGAKIDFNITPSHSIEGTFLSDEVDVDQQTFIWDRTGGTGRGDLIGESTLSRGGSSTIATYTGIFGEDILLSARYGKNTFNRQDLVTGDEYPAVYDHRSGSYIAMGQWVSWTRGRASDHREAYRLDVNASIGSHSIRGGLDVERSSSYDSTRNSGGAYFLYDIAAHHRAFVGGDLPDDQEIVRLRIFETAGDFNTESNALYLQDSWAINPALTVNIGVRYETFVNDDALGGRYINIDGRYAPRVGAIWDPTGSGRARIFGSIGRYFMPVPANANIRKATGDFYEHSYYIWDGTMDPESAAPLGFDWSTCERRNPESCANQGAVGDVIGYDLISDGEPPDRRATLASNLEPMSQDELVVGYEQRLGDLWSVSVRGMWRDVREVVEDYTIDRGLWQRYGVSCFDPSSPDFGTCASEYRLGNPGSDFEGFYDLDGDGILDPISLTADELGYPTTERTYLALELAFKRHFAAAWTLQGSYTWSHLYGNYEGWVNSEIGASAAGTTQSFDYPGLSDYSNGNLPQDRRHNLKLFGTYVFDFGLQVGAVGTYRSGRPINALGYHPSDQAGATYGAFSFYAGGEPSPRGSAGTTDSIVNLDLMLSYRGHVGDLQWTLRLDIFNLANAHAVTAVRELAEVFPGEADPNWGRATAHQQPRRARLGVGLEF